MQKRLTNRGASLARQNATSSSISNRAENDYYCTPEVAVKCLVGAMKELEIGLAPVVLDPAVGAGHLLRYLQGNLPYPIRVRGIDIVARGFQGDLILQDFLELSLEQVRGEGSLSIVTNPPYFKALAFTKHSLECLRQNEYFIELVKIQFLETSGRYELFKKEPPKYVVVFVNRISCGVSGVFDNNGMGGAACYCWLIWEKGYSGRPEVLWVDPLKYLDKK